MQNNVTDLSQKLQRSLDNNYNVIDMPAVIEIISTLEKTAVTKELLETTRLAKSINELRRRTSNESLAKRAKQLLKKWRDLILPNANGQVKPAPVTVTTTPNSNNIVTSSSSPAVGGAGERSNSPDTGQLSIKSRKRPARSTPDPHNPAPKRPVSSLNGQSRELDFSDNSNCSMKDFTSAAARKSDVIFINSDSNSSLPDHHSLDSHSNDPLDMVDSSTAVPKKRGRKKGSKNHKNLIIAAEESFTNKMSAVSRNSKVKTTQELLADLQNRTVVAKDIELRAAQLTESLSRIDQKLNPQKQINKNVTPIRSSERGVAAATTTPAARASGDRGGVTTPHSKPSNLEQHWPHRSTPEVVVLQSDDEIVDVVGTDPPQPALAVKSEPSTIPIDLLRQIKQESTATSSQPLTISGLLAQLPPIDPSVLEQPDDIPPCTCPLPPVQELPTADKITVQIVDGDVTKPADSAASSIFCPASPPLAFGQAPPTPEPPPPVAVVVAAVTPPTTEEADEEAGPCVARAYLRDRYGLDAVSEDKVALLHSRCLASLNGNVGLRQPSATPEAPPTTTTTEGAESTVGGLYVNIVPNITMERLRKDLSLRKSCAASENYKKYSISNHGDGEGGGDAGIGGGDVVGEHGDVVTCSRTAEMLGQCRTDADDYVAAIAAGDDVGTTVCKSTTAGDCCADGASSEFREWHETLDVLSYNGETLRILPYVIID